VPRARKSSRQLTALAAKDNKNRAKATDQDASPKGASQYRSRSASLGDQKQLEPDSAESLEGVGEPVKEHVTSPLKNRGIEELRPWNVGVGWGECRAEERAHRECPAHPPKDPHPLAEGAPPPRTVQGNENPDRRYQRVLLVRVE
jgi:hypothetical protein